jgi:hypothetical protein
LRFNIFSCLSPHDLCRLSATSRAFYVLASDEVRLLLHHYLVDNFLCARGVFRSARSFHV